MEVKIKLPGLDDLIQKSAEEREAERKAQVEMWRQNPNSMSMWLPLFMDKGFNIPETVIIPIEYERVNWLLSDCYGETEISKFNDEINNKLKELNFDTNRELFIKTGNFSNKFVFNHCHVKSTENIGEQYLNVFYGGMCVGCQICPEIVVREFIHTNYERKTIYDGMKLNTEFRVFYDFDNHKILDVFNYWDRDTMLENLRDEYDIQNFNDNIDVIEEDFKALRSKLEDEVNEKINDVQLRDIWSIDFMWDGQKMWLIDAAVGKQSYYYEKLQIDQKEV